MPTVSNYLFLRGLRQVDHTVFCVENGQKTYYDPLSRRPVPYSSGQQVKHSILDDLTDFMNEARATVTFNVTLAKAKDGKQTMSEGEPWSACDPSFVDQLIGGWMRASKSSLPVKRRSPLSISAMRPLHPTLVGLSNEIATFDRSNHPEQHKIRVTDDQGNIVSQEDFIAFLQGANRNAPMRKYIPSDQVGPRAAGLFIYDIAIDLRTLFTVSTSDNDPELDNLIKEKLLANGWVENADATRLICPKERREAIIPALAHSLINWRITSNQSRTYSPQNTLAVAFSDNANKISMAIRAELSETSDYQRAAPVIDNISGVQTYVSLTANAYIPPIVGASADALEAVEIELTQRLLNYNYER